MWLLFAPAANSRELYPGQYAQFSDEERAWFRGVRSPNGVPCCDVADGHLTSYETRGDVFLVPIEGELRPVPPESVVQHSRNPTGEAVVWYIKQGSGSYFIRCFVLPELG